MPEWTVLIAILAILPGLAILPSVLNARIGPYKWILFSILPVIILGGVFFFDFAIALETSVFAATLLLLILYSYLLGKSIHIKFSFRATPSSNTLFLSVAMVLSYVIGSIGATVAMLPVFLSANRSRRYSQHLGLAFYLSVWLKGGIPFLFLNPVSFSLFPELWKLKPESVALIALSIVAYLFSFFLLEVVIFAREPVHYDDNRNLALELRESIRDNEVRTSRILRAVDLLEEKATVAQGGFSLWIGVLVICSAVLLQNQYSIYLVVGSIVVMAVYALYRKEWRISSVVQSSLIALILYFLIAIVVLNPLIQLLYADLAPYTENLDSNVFIIIAVMVVDPSIGVWLTNFFYYSENFNTDIALIAVFATILVSAHPGWKWIRSESRMAGLSPGPWYARVAYTVYLGLLPFLILFFFKL